MTANSDSFPTVLRLIGRLKISATAAVVLSLIGLAAALLWPIASHADGAAASRRQGPRPLTSPKHDVQALQAKLAGQMLIRPSQVKAAVKDAGTAGRLLGQLKLHGVVQMPSGLVAYIEVKGEGVRDVRKDASILDFVVQDLRPGVVTLSLEGVEVQLKN